MSQLRGSKRKLPLASMGIIMPQSIVPSSTPIGFIGHKFGRFHGMDPNIQELLPTRAPDEDGNQSSDRQNSFHSL